MLIFIHLIISSLLSFFLKEFGRWALEIFSVHMVPAMQYVQLLFIPMWAGPPHFLHINK